MKPATNAGTDESLRLKLALDATDTGVWEWNLQTDDVIWDERMERLFGYAGGEFPGTYEGFSERVHPDDLPHVEAAHVHGIEDGFYQAAFRVVHDGAVLRWVKARAEVVYEHDEPSKMIGIVTDISDLKETEMALAAQNERLREFTNIVSHDLRNPISVIEGRVTLAADVCDTPHLAEALTAVTRMQELIDDLLTLARSGNYLGERERIELSAFVENCWSNVDTGDVRLVNQLDGVVEADKSRLAQVFENLFRNAIEHGGNATTLSVGRMDTGFFIEDDGAGIPSDIAESIFDTGYSQMEGGHGFGLAIVQEIVEAHSWEITATEGDDGGARFEITGIDFLE